MPFCYYAQEVAHAFGQILPSNRCRLCGGGAVANCATSCTPVRNFLRSSNHNSYEAIAEFLYFYIN